MERRKIVSPSQLNMKGSYRFEKWSDLNNYRNGEFKGLYKVSNFGRVYSVEKGKVLKPYVEGKGYLQVDLYKNGKRQQVKVHRLVATEFISNPENKPSVDHNDTNPKNNRVENLRWVTHTENMNNEITLAKRTNGRFIVIAYCALDNGEKLALALYKGISQAEREVQSFSENVTKQNIKKVLNPKLRCKTCGKISVTPDTSDEMLALIAIHDLIDKEIYWAYIQDWRRV